MPTTIAFINSKGGVGKTTSAVHVAECLALNSSVELVDADPQGSATDWAERSVEDGQPLRSSQRVANLRTLAKNSGNSDYVVVDTPPGNAGIIDAAISAADLIIVPTRPSAIDVARVWETLRTTASKPTAVLLVSVVLNTRSLADARAALIEEGIAVFDTVIPQREAIKGAFGHRPDRFYGYDDVVAELQKEMGI